MGITQHVIWSWPCRSSNDAVMSKQSNADISWVKYNPKVARKWLYAMWWMYSHRDNCWITPPATTSSGTVSCPDSAADNSVGMWHHALSLQPRTTVQRAAYFAQFKVDIDKYSSVPGLSADMTRSRLLSCWAGRVSGSADCMIHPDLGPEVCLQWAYSVPYSAVRCSTVQYSGPASTAALGWAGLGWWLGPHSGSGPARRVMQPPAGVNIITTF